MLQGAVQIEAERCMGGGQFQRAGSGDGRGGQVVMDPLGSYAREPIQPGEDDMQISPVGEGDDCGIERSPRLIAITGPHPDELRQVHQSVETVGTAGENLAKGGLGLVVAVLPLKRARQHQPCLRRITTESESTAGGGLRLNRPPQIAEPRRDVVMANRNFGPRLGMGYEDSQRLVLTVGGGQKLGQHAPMTRDLIDRRGLQQGDGAGHVSGYGKALRPARPFRPRQVARLRHRMRLTPSNGS